MKIKFHETLYDLYDLYVSPDTYNPGIRICLIKGENTYDHIIEDTEHIDSIYVYEDDGETINAIYSNAKNRNVVIVKDEWDYVCVEYTGPSLEERISALTEQLNTKADSSVLSKSAEEIGQPSKKPYNEGETFEAGGKLYKALCYISVGNVLVEDGNCKTISIEELTKEETQ